jgi:hypothetical protein
MISVQGFKGRTKPKAGVPTKIRLPNAASVYAPFRNDAFICRSSMTLELQLLLLLIDGIDLNIKSGSSLVILGYSHSM